MNCIGIDVSKSTLHVHIPNNALDLEIENNHQAIKSLYAKLKKIYKKEIADLIWVYEPTGSYSQTLTEFCADKKIKVFMINPKQSHNYAKAVGQRGKSDKVDAKMLSRAIGIAKEEEIAVPVINRAEQELKTLIGYYKFTTKQRVQTNNHLESLSIKDSSCAVVKKLQKRVKELKHQEEQIIEEIKVMIGQDALLTKKFAIINSIVGVGDIASIALLHLFLKYPHANQRQIISLSGLDPVERTSGSSIKGKSSISKAGSRLYRGSLFMSAMVAIRYNLEMKKFFTRLKNNGKHTTVAQIAVMKKLIIIAHSLYKNDCYYDAGYYQQQCGNSAQMAKVA
jgi:transposase